MGGNFGIFMKYPNFMVNPNTVFQDFMQSRHSFSSVKLYPQYPTNAWFIIYPNSGFLGVSIFEKPHPQ